MKKHEIWKNKINKNLIEILNILNDNMFEGKRLDDSVIFKQLDDTNSNYEILNRKEFIKTFRKNG